MGCDIHAYIDVDYGSNKEDRDPYVKSFAEVHISRDYELFAYMANVRNNGLECVSEPKGLPEHLGWLTLDKYSLYVVEDEEYKNIKGYEYCSRSNAEKWVSSYGAHWLDKEHKRVSNPDWHSASWLSLDELLRVHELYIGGKEDDWGTQRVLLQKINKEDPDFMKKWKDVMENTPQIFRKPNEDLVGIIGAMKAIEAEGVIPRLVFWFDN